MVALTAEVPPPESLDDHRAAVDRSRNRRLFADLDLDAVDAGLGEQACRDPRGDCLDQAVLLVFDHLAHQVEGPRVVDCVGDVVGPPGVCELHAQLDVDVESIAQGSLSLRFAVVAVERHTFENEQISGAWHGAIVRRGAIDDGGTLPAVA